MTHPIRVLLVEDTEIAQKIAKTQLERQGCAVDIAENGEIALQMIKNNHYDLILMDIGLGEGIDGFETTQRIKSTINPNQLTPIIAITSHDGKDFLEKAQQVGMLSYFNKPFTSQSAQDIISLLEKHFKNTTI